MINNIKSLFGLDYFTSELDQFLNDFDKAHPKLSTSQRLEKEKFARIYKLRDDPRAGQERDSFWENF